MKKLVCSFLVAAFAVVGFSTTSASANSPRNVREGTISCKPVGAACTNSDSCCSKNCQSVNGKETCT